MTSVFDPERSENRDFSSPALAPCQSVECQLFESLVHHLVEKGVLTKNDALSVVQTVAEVKRGEQEEGRHPAATTARDISALAQLYSSFELLRDGPTVSGITGAQNIVQMRPPLHGDEPQFPRDD